MGVCFHCAHVHWNSDIWIISNRVFICSFSDRLESAVRIWRICRAEEFCYCFYIKDDSCGNTEYSGLCGSICADYTASFRVFASLLSKKLKGKRFFRIVYFLPNIIMPAAVAMVWRWLLNTRYGLVNIVLGDLGLPTPSWISDPKFIMISLIIVEVWSGIGYNTIILLAAIQGISAEMYESADLDGASGFQKFWKITLPLVSPSMFFLLTMGLMKAMRAFDMIYMFIGKDAWSTGGPLLEAVRTMVYGIYFNGFTRMDMGMASAESVVLFIMIMIVTGIQFKLQDKWVNYD